MVDRRSPFRVEARRSSAAQKQFYPSLAKLPKQPNFLAQKRVLLASQEVAICPDVGLCANASRYIIALINGINKLPFKIQAKGIEQEVGVPSRRRHAQDRELSGIG